MNNSTVLKGLMVGATMLADLASGAESANVAATAPVPTTVNVVSSFVDGFAASEGMHALAIPPTSADAGRATDVTLYPTADSEVVFVSFRIAGAERIALVETKGGHVARFTDFTGTRPRHVSTATGQVGDAQTQARTLLQTMPSSVTVASQREPNGRQRGDAQEQAADVLQFASIQLTPAERSKIVARYDARSFGDSSQMARAFLTSSNYE